MLISLGVVFQVICILQAVSTRGVLVRLISVSAKQVFTAEFPLPTMCLTIV